MVKNQATTKSKSSSLWQTISAVLSAFFGVRKSKAHQRDLEKLNPVHVIITGIVLALLFILFLLFCVRLALQYA